MVNLSNVSLFSTITPADNLSFVNSCQLFDCHTRSVLNIFGNIITVSTVTPEIDFETASAFNVISVHWLFARAVTYSTIPEV